MFCMKCMSSITADDLFCPKCGAVLRGPRPGEVAAAPGAPAVVIDATPDQGARVSAHREAIPEAGEKYTGLSTAAEVMINGASAIRMLSYVIAALGAVSAIVWLHPLTGLGILVGAVVGLVLLLLGWMTWLSLTVFGELMYVVIDVEENLRRRV